MVLEPIPCFFQTIQKRSCRVVINPISGTGEVHDSFREARRFGCIKFIIEIKEIGQRIETAVSAYFESVNQKDPTYNFQWEYILVDNDKIKNA